jgi:hypothetical protein
MYFFVAMEYWFRGHDDKPLDFYGFLAILRQAHAGTYINQRICRFV